MILRPYQKEAIDALDEYVMRNSNNPCIVIPTGGGKSLIMASIVARWRKRYPTFRCLVLAHRLELVQQNMEEFVSLSESNAIDAGIYSSALNIRDTSSAVIFASIDSVYTRANEFGHINCVIIDEAHRIPVSGDGKYRRFIADLRAINPRLRVVGFTATPYRLDCGPVCHKDHTLNEIAFEVSIGELIDNGYLCPLRSKVSINAPDISNVKRLGNKGDFVLHELASICNKDEIVTDAVSNALAMLRRDNRSHTIWFCIDVEHAKAVQAELMTHGEVASIVTGNTSAKERNDIVTQFRNGDISHLCNCNCFTEGFNAKNVDSIVLLRPTMSKGLYIQMVGRGLRLHPSKKDCLILDYARCIETHGTIDAPNDQKVRIKVCENCRNAFSWAVKVCPECGWEIPKQEVERVEREEAERKMHERIAAEMSILGLEPTKYDVDEVMIARHVKKGRPDSLRITYRCGLKTFNEWICLDHDGCAGQKAKSWWQKRFPTDTTATVDSVMANYKKFNQQLTEMTTSIVVVLRGQYWQVLGHKLKG